MHSQYEKVVVNKILLSVPTGRIQKISELYIYNSE